MGDENNYGDFQNPDSDYANSQNPGTLYADNSPPTAKAPPPQPAATSKPASKPPTTTPPVPPTTTPPVIRVTVNPASKIKAAQFVDIMNKTAGLPSELKGKIKNDKSAVSIIFPDFSKEKVVPGKEWLFDLGKAGNDWEFTTATLILVLDGAGFFKFKEDLQKGEERGFVVSKDPEDELLGPSSDLKSINKGLIIGLTIPNQSMLDKHPPPANTIPPPQIARLTSGKGLILIANNLIVEKKGNQTKDSIPLPQPMIAMSCLHELSAHASFFELGQDAAHSDPMDPAKNAVDRNAEQLAIIYKASIDKEQSAFENKIKVLVDGMNKAVP